MSSFNTYIKFLVQVQKTTNLLLTYNNENNTNTDNGIKFTLFTECYEYDVTKIDKEISQNIYSEITATVSATPPKSEKISFWLDITDGNILKEIKVNGDKTIYDLVTQIYKVNLVNQPVGWESYWKSGNYYNVLNGVGNALNGIYYDNTIINITNGTKDNFKNNNIIMYNIPGGIISLYRVEKDKSDATLIIDNKYYYFNNTGKEKIYLYVPIINNNTYKPAQDGYYKLNNTNTSDIDLSNGLYNSNNEELTSPTGTYNLICVNTKNIYMSNRTKKQYKIILCIYVITK